MTSTSPQTAHATQIDPAATTRLLRAVPIALLIAAAVIAMVLVLVQRREWWNGYLAATIVSILSAAASLPPLWMGLRRDLMKAVTGAFTAAAIRAIVSLGGCILVVKALHYPAAPTLLIMVVYYLAVLAAESMVVAQALWKLRA